MSSPASTGGPRRSVAGFVATCVGILVVPFVWRPLVLRWGPPVSTAPASYLPAVQPPRDRHPFDPEPISGLQSSKPAYVIIGDSMAGRVDPERLAELAGGAAVPVLRPASSSAYWFLVFKNYVVTSGITPRCTVVFFRDTNMTDLMWRLTGMLDDPQYGSALDEVALDREEDLNAVVAARVQGGWPGARTLVDRLYGVERARSWLEPAVPAWLSRLVVGGRRRAEFLNEVNAAFWLDRLRPLPAADIEAAEDRDLDFASNVTTSTLPLFVRLAREHRLHVCFVRVLRRPVDGRPPEESPALVRYVRDLRRYLESNGAALLDDRDDPEMARLAYDDGDHIASEAKRRYTELLYARLSKLAW